jgi:amino acid transporter
MTKNEKKSFFRSLGKKYFSFFEFRATTRTRIHSHCWQILTNLIIISIFPFAIFIGDKNADSVIFIGTPRILAGLNGFLLLCFNDLYHDDKINPSDEQKMKIQHLSGVLLAILVSFLAFIWLSAYYSPESQKLDRPNQWFFYSVNFIYVVLYLYFEFKYVRIIENFRRPI